MIISCKKNESTDIVTFDPGLESFSSDYEAVFSRIEILPIRSDFDSSAWFGKITDVKRYGDLFYLFDPDQSESITVINNNGKVTGQLKKPGDTTGTYKRLFAFAVDLASNSISVYSRSNQKITTYGLPDFQFLNERKVESFLMNLEYVDEKKLLCFNDQNSHDEFLTLLTESTSELLMKATYGFAGEAAEAWIFNEKQKHFFEPFSNILWQWDSAKSELKKLFQLEIKNQEVPEKLLESQNVLAIQDFFFQDENLLLFNNTVLINETLYGFVYRDLQEKLFFVIDMKNKEVVRVYNWESLFEVDYMPYPNCADENGLYSIAYLYPSQVKEMKGRFSLPTDGLEFIGRQEKPYLLKFYMK